MKKIILTLFTLTTFTAMAADECAFNFKDFHSLLDQKSKKYKGLKPETKDEVSKTITQEARLRKTGEKVLFIGGGCAHVNYAFIFSNVKFKTKKVEEQFKKTHDLLKNLDVKPGYTDVLVTALANAMKKPIKKSPHDVYDLACGDAICNLDLSQKNSMKISYSFDL